VGNLATIVDGARKVGRALLDLVYPPFCVGCGQVGSVYCLACRDAAVPIRPPLCIRCGRPQETWCICQRCIVDPLPVDGVRSVAIFEGALRGAIHQFKYGYVRDLAEPLSEMLISYLQETPISADWIVPVPLHPRRLKQRGYNQAALLAHRLGSALGIPVHIDCLRRNRYTVAQTRLSAQERSRNVQGAFSCGGSGLRDKVVLLVDDVFTTGATLGACSHALRVEGGAKSVWALTVARAMSIQDS
jgi:competence protein ComFC